MQFKFFLKEVICIEIISLLVNASAQCDNINNNNNKRIGPCLDFVRSLAIDDMLLSSKIFIIAPENLHFL